MSQVARYQAERMLADVEERSGRPLRAMIEISDRCNEVCVHCYQEQGQKGEMSTEQVKALMDELADMGVLMLTISGGEATLRHDFIELLEHARSKSFAIRLFTNGLTMTAALAAEMKRLAVQSIEISLYSHRAETHDFVTGVPGSFDKTVAGIRHLIAAGVDVHVKTPAMRVNEHELHAYADFVSGLGATHTIDPNFLLAREDGDRAPMALSRSDAAFERLLRDPELGGERPVEAPTPLARSNDLPLCGAGLGVHIEPNGELRPCVALEMSLGNALEGVERARESSSVRQGLRDLRWSHLHGCRDCDLANYCSRCHASARTEGGDALGPYASACANARSSYKVARDVLPQILPREGSDATSIEIGPYRHIEGDRFRAVADVVTAEDEALAARLGWTRRVPGGLRSSSELVQLRRPGRSKRPVMIPAALQGALSQSHSHSHSHSNEAIKNTT